MNNLRENISTRILDFVEGIPRFRKGTISSLQDIREWQRKRATKSYLERKIPKEIDIELSQMTLVVTFEHENFKLIQIGLNKLFPKSEKIYKFIQTLKESEDSLHASSWHNLGYITKSKKGFIPDVEVIDDLPNEVDYVSLSFHRIMPSVACIIFEFKIINEVSKKIKAIQDREHLNQVVFRKFWPINKLHHSYSMGGGYGKCFERISSERDNLRECFKSWVSKNFRWNKAVMETASYVDVYKIDGNVTQSNMIKEWLSKNSRWLQDFGVSVNGFDSYFSHELVYTTSNNSGDISRYVDIVTKLKTEDESKFGDFLEYKVRAIAIATTLHNVIGRYRIILEKLRSKGFKNIYSGNKNLIKKPSNMQELKKLVTLISRLEQEMDQSEHWISHEISEVGELKDMMREEDVDLGKNTIQNIKYQISQIKRAAEVIDSGLTDYLSIQNIYIMYKLQKWMFILSIVVTVATIVGVVSGWNDLKPIILGWINA